MSHYEKEDPKKFPFNHIRVRIEFGNISEHPDKDENPLARNYTNIWTAEMESTYKIPSKRPFGKRGWVWWRFAMYIHISNWVRLAVHDFSEVWRKSKRIKP